LGDIDSKIFKQLEALVNEGKELVDIVSTYDRHLGGNMVSRVSAWVARSNQIIEQLSTRDGTYSESFSSIIAQDSR